MTNGNPIVKKVTLYVVNANGQSVRYATKAQANKVAEVLTRFGIESTIEDVKAEIEI